MADDDDPKAANNPTADDDHGGPSCPMCGAPLYERHCKYVCPQHGVVVDCSDPFTF